MDASPRMGVVGEQLRSRDGQHGQAGPTAVRPTFRLVQVLRAVAALMVVAHHATIMLTERLRLGIFNWINGGSGVDLFFVISGFVMTISSEPLRGAAHPARTFLARRLERVVPMYWLVTGVKVLVVLLVPGLAVHALGSWQHVAASFLFWPSVNPEAAFEPVVVVGWTLNFEMLFYALFAVALAMRWRPLALLAPVLLALALWPVVGHVTGPVWLHFYASTLLLEFLFGMLLGLGVRAVERWPWPVGVALLVAGMLPLLLWVAPNFSVWRGVLWGVPALLVMAGVVALERRWGTRSPRWALLLGDASYSIYLTHTFALPAVGLLLVRRWHGWPGEIIVSFLLAVGLSTLAGVGVYRAVELPITRWFKGRRRTAVPVVG